MRTDEPHVAHAVRIVDLYNQPILVALDIEHHTAAFDDACAAVLLLHLCRLIPVFLFHFAIPSLHRLFGLRKSLPKRTQGAFRYDSHDEDKMFPKTYQVTCSLFGTILWQ